MMASTLTTHFRFYHHHHHLHHKPLCAPSIDLLVIKTQRTRRRPQPTLSFSYFNPNPRSSRSVLARASSDGGGPIGPQQPAATDTDETKSKPPGLNEVYVPLFVRLLGLDNEPQDREHAVVGLWHYSLGGKKCIDNIMQFQGCLNLVVNLLKSESNTASEAAAGLLQTIASVNIYRDSVAECGAMEEIVGLLTRSSLSYEVKEQCLCTLWNLSVDERFRVKIANADVIPLLVKLLDDEFIGARKAAGGILANLALSQSNHSKMVEEGVIPRLAKLLTTGEEGSSVFIRDGSKGMLNEDYMVIIREAKNVLLELAKDEYYRILIIEEGLVRVPLIGAAAYKSLESSLYSRPAFPDGTTIEQTYKGQSRHGASELLVGLNVSDKDVNIDKAKQNAMIGWARQRFLARQGAIETNDEKKSQSDLFRDQQYALLPWVDGLARLSLILELDDESAISRAAEAIADMSINEHMRTSFKEAGGVRHLVRLLDSKSDAVKLAVIGALDRLSVSNNVCRVIEDEGAIHPLIKTLKNLEISENMLKKVLNILTRILDPSKAKSKLGAFQFCDESINGSEKAMDAEMLVPEKKFRNDVLDSAFLARMVEVLKTSSPDLQRKAASVLEFITVIDSSMDTISSVDIQSGLHAVFQQNFLNDMESDLEGDHPELYALKVEEAGLAISAGCRLLTRLLDHKQFCLSVNALDFTGQLRELLKSNIPLESKEMIGSCLIKLSHLTEPQQNAERTISLDVTLYETIPRLVEQIRTSFSPEAQEGAVVELDRIVSEGVAESARVVACNGGIFPLVKLLEEGSDRAVEASLSVLNNLSMDSENHPTITAAGAVPILRRIVMAERPQWHRALHLLRTLPTQ